MTHKLMTSTKYQTRVTKKASAGFTLLEVLVALLVLSVGLLGLAALQTFSLKLNHQAYERTQATLLIDDIIDRMRANPEGVKLGAYNSVSSSTTLPSYNNCATTDCRTGTDFANYDIAMWKSAIQANGMLAAGTGAIESPDGMLFTVTVTWQEHDLTMNQTMTVRLN